MAATITQADTHYTNTVKNLIEYPADRYSQQNFC